MAESLGLGVLYSGFFVVCTKLSEKLRKLIFEKITAEQNQAMVFSRGEEGHRADA